MCAWVTGGRGACLAGPMGEPTRLGAAARATTTKPATYPASRMGTATTSPPAEPEPAVAAQGVLGRCRQRRRATAPGRRAPRHQPGRDQGGSNQRHRRTHHVGFVIAKHLCPAATYHRHPTPNDRCEGRGPQPGRHGGRAGQDRAVAPSPALDAFLQGHRPVRAGHGHLPVQEGRRGRPPRYRRRPGRRQGATATTGDDGAQELRSRLPRRVPARRDRGLRLRGRHRERPQLRRRANPGTPPRPVRPDPKIHGGQAGGSTRRSGAEPGPSRWMVPARRRVGG